VQHQGKLNVKSIYYQYKIKEDNNIVAVD